MIIYILSYNLKYRGQYEDSSEIGQQEPTDYSKEDEGMSRHWTGKGSHP